VQEGRDCAEGGFYLITDGKSKARCRKTDFSSFRGVAKKLGWKKDRHFVGLNPKKSAGLGGVRFLEEPFRADGGDKKRSPLEAILEKKGGWTGIFNSLNQRRRNAGPARTPS